MIHLPVVAVGAGISPMEAPCWIFARRSGISSCKVSPYLTSLGRGRNGFADGDLWGYGFEEMEKVRADLKPLLAEANGAGGNTVGGL